MHRRTQGLGRGVDQLRDWVRHRRRPPQGIVAARASLRWWDWVRPVRRRLALRVQLGRRYVPSTQQPPTSTTQRATWRAGKLTAQSTWKKSTANVLEPWVRRY